MQKHEAARQAPRQLRAQSQGHSDARLAQRTLRLRIYATPAYSASVVNWHKQFETTLECANAVFTSEFGAKFEVAEFLSFRPQADEEQLNGLLDELLEKDTGQDVDWVIGLARPVPRFAASADDLGMARLLSNHFVMRAMSDQHEYEAIQSALSELGEDERHKLYNTRKQHKLCSVFLHEVAHTLGVPHEQTESSLMHARYHLKSYGYSDEAAQLVRGALSLRATRPNLFLDSDFAQTLGASLSAPAADWEAAGRDQILRELASFKSRNTAVAGTGTRGTTSTAPPANTATAAPSGGPAAAATTISGLTPDEQRTYDRARAELSAGHGLAARQIAAPLLASRATMPGIKTLRCEIAMSVGGDFEAISAECPGLSTFGGGH